MTAHSDSSGANWFTDATGRIGSSFRMASTSFWCVLVPFFLVGRNLDVNQVVREPVPVSARRELPSRRSRHLLVVGVGSLGLISVNPQVAAIVGHDCEE